MTIGEIVDSYLQELEDEGKRHDKVRSQLRPIMCRFSHKDAEALTVSDLDRYRRTRRRETTIRGGAPSHSTINREVRCLLAALRRAQRRGEARRVPEPRWVPERPNPQPWCRQEDLQALLTHLRPRHPPVADLVELYFWTGWRRRELLDLRWDEVDWEQRALILPASRAKTRDDRVFPLEGPPEEILRRRWALRDGPFVFHREGRRIRDFRRAWKSATRAIGREDLTIHSFRRSFATYATLSGVPERLLMELGGWKTAVVRRYQIVDPWMLRESMRRLVGYLEGPNGRQKKTGQAP